ncbi:MAG: hypothetical protein ACFFD4_29295 [Candidatus Odinarchaeota archaeon]
MEKRYLTVFSKILGIFVILSLVISFFLPAFTAVTSILFLGSSEGKYYQEEAYLTFNSSMWSYQSLFELTFIILLAFLGILALLLPQKYSSISSLLWAIFAAEWLTEWLRTDLGFTIQLGPITAFYFIPGPSKSFQSSITNHSVNYLILAGIILAFTTALIDGYLALANKTDPLDTIDREKPVHFITYLISAVLLILLPLGFGPAFTNTSVILYTIPDSLVRLHPVKIFPLNHTFLLPVAVLLVTFLWLIIILQVIPIITLLEATRQRKNWNLEKLAVLVPVSLVLYSFITALTNSAQEIISAGHELPDWINKTYLVLVLVIVAFAVPYVLVFAGYRKRWFHNAQRVILNKMPALRFDRWKKSALILIITIVMFPLLFLSAGLFLPKSMQIEPNFLHPNHLNYKVEAKNPVLHANGTLATVLEYRIEGGGLLDQIRASFKAASRFTIDACFIDTDSNGEYDQNIPIISMHDQGNALNVSHYNDSSTWYVTFINQTDFKVEMDPTSLPAVGSSVSVAFCRKVDPLEVTSFKYGENMELEYVVQLELTVQVVA